MAKTSGGTRKRSVSKRSMKHIKTGELTYNKRVKARARKLFPTAHSVLKKHVPGVGYVRFFKNKKGKVLGKVFREQMKGMTITIG